MPESLKYDKVIVQAIPQYQEKLKRLYLTLMDQKYLPIIAEQRRQAATDLEKQIKRLARDQGAEKVIKELIN